MDNFKEALTEYQKLTEYLKAENMQIRYDTLRRSEGGYLLPEFVTEPRKGVIGYLARLIKHDYGWIQVKTFDIIKNKIEQTPIITRIKL